MFLDSKINLLNHNKFMTLSMMQTIEIGLHSVINKILLELNNNNIDAHCCCFTLNKKKIIRHSDLWNSSINSTDVEWTINFAERFKTHWGRRKYEKLPWFPTRNYFITKLQQLWNRCNGQKKLIFPSKRIIWIRTCLLDGYERNRNRTKQSYRKVSSRETKNSPTRSIPNK